MRVRRYGESGPFVVLVHGGPGAPGHMAPVARGLEDSFRVIEPFQRGSGEEPLTVARHVTDLEEVVRTECGGAAPIVVGFSWGAMLVLAWAAKHPDSAGPLVLIGCGTFDEEARARLLRTLEERMDDDLRARIESLAEEIADPDERLAATGEIFESLYACDPLPEEEDGGEACDDRAHQETWDDMIRLQSSGVYPAAFEAIRSPVLLLQGDYDPHPGPMIRDGLAAHLPRLEYRELAHCGHYPWKERAARDEFFAVLREWLTVRSAEERGGPDPALS